MPSEDDLKQYREKVASRKGGNIKGLDLATSPKPKPKKRGMNGTERRYADDFLVPMLLAGEIAGWMFEGLSFKLADGARYKPDFAVWYPDGRLENIEIKGGSRKGYEASMVRVKVARERHPWTTFQVVQWKDGVWIEKVKP